MEKAKGWSRYEHDGTVREVEHQPGLSSGSRRRVIASGNNPARATRGDGAGGTMYTTSGKGQCVIDPAQRAL